MEAYYSQTDSYRRESKQGVVISEQRVKFRSIIAVVSIYPNSCQSNSNLLFTVHRCQSATAVRRATKDLQSGGRKVLDDVGRWPRSGLCYYCCCCWTCVERDHYSWQATVVEPCAANTCRRSDLLDVHSTSRYSDTASCVARWPTTDEYTADVAETTLQCPCSAITWCCDMTSHSFRYLTLPVALTCASMSLDNMYVNRWSWTVIYAYKME